MIVTPSSSISTFQAPTPLAAAQNTAGNSAQPFAKQFTTAVSSQSSVPPLGASGPAPASASPAILSVTILPWGPSIAYASPAAQSTSLLPATPVIPPVTASTAATSVQTPTATLAVATPAAAAPLPASQQAINAVSEILSGYGVNPASLGLSYSEQVVAGPGGAYTNNSITAHLPSGKSQDFSAELTFKNPKVTAVEILAMLGRKIMA